MADLNKVEERERADLWQALDHHGHSICTVIAHGEEEAKDAVRDQLLRPGRYGYHEWWKKGGCRVQRKEV